MKLVFTHTVNSYIAFKCLLLIGIINNRSLEWTIMSQPVVEKVEDTHTTCSLRGARGAPVTLKKTREDRARPKGNTLYWYAQSSNSNTFVKGEWRHGCMHPLGRLPQTNPDVMSECASPFWERWNMGCRTWWTSLLGGWVRPYPLLEGWQPLPDVLWCSDCYIYVGEFFYNMTFFIATNYCQKKGSTVKPQWWSSLEEFSLVGTQTRQGLNKQQEKPFLVDWT